MAAQRSPKYTPNSAISCEFPGNPYNRRCPREFARSHAHTNIYIYNYPAIGAANGSIDRHYDLSKLGERRTGTEKKRREEGEEPTEIFHRSVRKRQVPRRCSLNGSANRLAPGTRPITDFFLSPYISPRREETPKLYQKDTRADGAGVYEKHRCPSRIRAHLHAPPRASVPAETVNGRGAASRGGGPGEKATPID